MKLPDRLETLLATVTDGCERFAMPLVLLGFRLYLFRTFFFSGLVKAKKPFPDLVEDFQSLYFYGYDHLPTAFLAGAGMVTELSCGALLLLGLFARVAAAPLFFTTLIIQFVARNEYGGNYYTIDHYGWMLALLLVAIAGPGPLSLDRLLHRRLAANKG